MFKWIAGSLLMLTLTVASADAVYRDTAPDGSVRYSDKPRSRSAKAVHLPPLSGPIPGRSTKYFASEAALRAAARFAVSVESPTPGQVVQPRGQLVLAASVMPGLVKGFRLVYTIDGKSVTDGPVDRLSVALARPPAPGRHELRIAVLDPTGREVARSSITPFWIKAPK